jgi:hypothetical protein
MAALAPNRTLPARLKLTGTWGRRAAVERRSGTGQWGSSLPLVSRPINIVTTLSSAKQTMIAAATLNPPSAAARRPAISGQSWC